MAQNQRLEGFWGCFSSKIHEACDAIDKPDSIHCTDEEASDCIQDLMLLEGLKAKAILADKVYDVAEEMVAEVVIPAKSNRKNLNHCQRLLQRAQSDKANL